MNGKLECAALHAGATHMHLEFREALVSEDGETQGSSDCSSCNETTGSSPKSTGTWSLATTCNDERTSSVFDELFVEIPVTAPSTPPVPIDQRAFPTPQLSVFAALWDNGAILGIACSSEFTWKSKHVASDIPVALHPTPLQQMKVHFTWIDRFPFPQMRDNMITLSGVFNEEDFLEDLFKQPSFTLKPGGLSWDPAAWKIAQEFGTKWGYLFY
jgi:Domain of unknown function (DUF3425)